MLRLLAEAQVVPIRRDRPLPKGIKPEDCEKQLNSLVNQLSRLSKKHHKPMKMNDLDTFVKWCYEHIDTT